jgi:hypothetical protein
MEKTHINFVKIYPQIGNIEDSNLRKSVVEILEEVWIASSWQSLDKIPTSAEISYPNLPHTQCVVELALAIADTFERHHGVIVNRDNLIAAAVLQDASKLVEYSPAPEGERVESTDIGKWYPHAFWCAHLCVSKDLPKEVTNAVLTHSPGSAQFPKSLEGKILYYADQLDVIAIHKDRWKKQIFITK